MTPDEAAAEVRRIEITTRHLVRDIVAGEYASAFRGRGVEFAEVREYQPGDDIRSIDWNVTARLGTAYVKRHLEERELTVMFAVDYSASGRFGSRRRAKADTGLEVAAVLALAAARSNDRIGALCFTDRAERYIPPRKGRRQALRVVSELLAYDPAGRRTDLAASLGWLDTVLRRRSVLFILSDFMSDGWGGALDRLATRHDVVAVRLTDPRERALPDAGLAAMADPETGAWTWVDTSSAAVREHFARAAAAFDRHVEHELRRRGADLLALDTTEPYGEALVTFFRRRELRKGGPAPARHPAR